MKLKDFFKEEYTNYAFYDNYRNLACYVDGLKPTQRKAIHTVLKDNISDPMKVASFASKVIQDTEYLHGPGSMEGAIVGLAQSFVGANNIPLLADEGSFGTRFNRANAATRYIFTCKTKNLDKIFLKDDNEILNLQEFEGKIIEPKHFVPTLPLLLINGSRGVGNGFAQVVLPRNPEKIRKAVNDYIKTKEIDESDLIPEYLGFTGNIEKRSDNPKGYSVEGKIQIENANTIKILDIPPFYQWSDYIEILDALVDTKKIKSYKDSSNHKTSKFDFTIKVEKNDKPERYWLETLKLVELKRTVENLTCMDENNSIIVFENPKDLLIAFVDYKLKSVQERKEKQLAKMREEMNFMKMKYQFIVFVNKGTIVLSNRSKDEVISNIKEQIQEIQEDHIDKLLNMSLWSITKEKAEELKDALIKKSNDIKSLEANTPENIYLEELNSIKF